MVVRGGEQNDGVYVWMSVSDDLIINDPPIRRIINSFETLKTVSDIVDRLERGRETERDHSDEKLEEQYGTALVFTSAESQYV